MEMDAKRSFILGMIFFLSTKVTTTDAKGVHHDVSMFVLDHIRTRQDDTVLPFSILQPFVDVHANGNNTIVVTNNLQVRSPDELSTGIGLKNIIKRYLDELSQDIRIVMMSYSIV